MEFKDLIGKIIISAKQKKLINYDDEGFLELGFSDGTGATVVAYYYGYTGESEDEYPTGISIVDYKENLEDVLDNEN
jgi:hypothetical protein